jgi:predicted nucleic acid-binding Zn ribbon protein
MAKEPRRLGNIVNQLLARRGYANVRAELELQEVFATIVGPTIAGQATVGRLKRSILEIIVADSATMQELTFQKTKLLKQLQNALGDDLPKDLRFRLGKP